MRAAAGTIRRRPSLMLGIRPDAASFRTVPRGIRMRVETSTSEYASGCSVVMGKLGPWGRRTRPHAISS